MDSFSDSLHMDSVIRGHHVYKHVWTPIVGEVLHVEQEAHNPEDRFAVDCFTVAHFCCLK